MEQNVNISLQCHFNVSNSSLYKKLFLCSFVQYNVSTCQLVQTPEEIDFIKKTCEASYIIHDFGLWFSLVTGGIGNILTILTLWSLPKTPATFYVGLLAVSDLTGLFFAAFRYFIISRYNYAPRFSVSDNFLSMMFDFCASFSNWLLVFICLERFATIRFPLQKRYYFTHKRTVISAIVLALVLFTIYNIMLWTLGYASLKLYRIRFVVYAALPLIIILGFICLISCQFRRIHRDRQNLNGQVHSRVSLSRLSDKSGRHSPARQSPKRHRKVSGALEEIARLENSMTIIMFVAALTFFLLIFPHNLIFITFKEFSARPRTPVNVAIWQILYRISTALTFFSLSVNFLLYFLSAKKFRVQLFYIIRNRKLSYRTNVSQLQRTMNNLSTTEMVPIQSDVNRDYFSCQVDNEIICDDTMNSAVNFSLESVNATPDVGQKNCETYLSMYTEMDCNATTQV